VKKVARYVADHYVQNVELLGYKVFLVGVDREACAFYKEALDAILPPEYAEVVYTGTNNDPAHLKKWHLDEKRERQIRNHGELRESLMRAHLGDYEKVEERLRKHVQLDRTRQEHPDRWSHHLNNSLPRAGL